MKIKPIAFESLGVRSMATYVETQDVKIFIDPGASVCPDRYSLPPHKIELDRHFKITGLIKQWVLASDLVIITHYHDDHHNADCPEIYKNKDIMLKNPREFINENQRTRAVEFLNRIENQARAISTADDATFQIGKTRITFSEPMTHGATDRQGYILQVLIEEDQRFVFTSDVQGPATRDAVDFIIESQPHIIYVDGPPTYLLGSVVKKTEIDASMDHLKSIIDKTPVRQMIIDHHLMRDLDWQNYILTLAKTKNGVAIQSAAAFSGEKEDLLEAKRKDFYEGKSPNVDNYG
jgi:predicted metallo-beta-lactamase superfamily hydrolase